MSAVEIQNVQRLVNERDDLEHRKLAAGTRAMRYPKDSHKRDRALDEALACAERIKEIDEQLNANA